MYRIQRRHNNNVVQATDDSGRSLVLIGRGVGFGVVKDEPVDPELVEMTYVLETQQRAAAIADALGALPPEVLILARHAVVAATDRLGVSNPASLLLPLAEHLSAAVERTRSGGRFVFPLTHEIIQLYPAELDFGRHVCRLTLAELGVTLPADEAAAFAMHAVSSQFGNSRISAAVAMTEMIDDILRMVETESGVAVDRGSRAAGRFITHIRYLFARLTEGGTVESGREQVVEAIHASLARSWDIAELVAAHLHRQMGRELSRNEIAYLTMHIGRLTGA